MARQFSPEGPNKLWVADITEHPTSKGRVYCAVVIDAWNRQVVGHSIADHLRAELVVDALEMACWRQRPVAGQTVHHSDHGTQYTSWAFGQRLRHAGLLEGLHAKHVLIRPHCPWQNGKAERFNRTLQTEWAYRQAFTTNHDRTAALAP